MRTQMFELIDAKIFTSDCAEKELNDHINENKDSSVDLAITSNQIQKFLTNQKHVKILTYCTFDHQPTKKITKSQVIERHKKFTNRPEQRPSTLFLLAFSFRCVRCLFTFA